MMLTKRRKSTESYGCNMTDASSFRVKKRKKLLTLLKRLKMHETVPTVAAVHDICRFRGVPMLQPAEDTQTMTHTRSTISLVVRLIFRSKNNFYDGIRLKIIESWYFPKETVKVGLEKSKQDGGQLNSTKCRWISMAEISNLDHQISALKQWTGWERKWVEKHM